MSIKLFLVVFGIIVLLAVPSYLMSTYLFRRIRRGIREKPGGIWYFNTAVFSLFALALFFVLLLALYGVGYWAYTSIRNYYGYCTYPSYAKRELRGHRFTTEERLDIAINYYLGDQRNDYREIRAVEGMKEASLDDVEKYFTLIPYGSKDEFLRENPDCCELIPYSSHQNMFIPIVIFGDHGRGDERASGRGDGKFSLKYKIRYMDGEGNRKETMIFPLPARDLNKYIRVDNCGNPEYYYDLSS